MSESEKMQLLERVSQLDPKDQERLGWFVAGMNAKADADHSRVDQKADKEEARVNETQTQ